MNIAPFHSHSHLPLLIARQQGVQPQSPLSAEHQTQDQAEVEKLRRRDREVRAHEQAHIASAGGLAKGGANFSFQLGPDGKQYAVGGEVNIDTSAVPGNPKATIQKAKQIRAAAHAPADPSAQDRAVAAAASALEAQAQQELQKEKQEATAAEGENAASPVSPRIDLFV